MSGEREVLPGLQLINPLLVTGSLNAKTADRFMDRRDVHPVLALQRGVVQPMGFFDPWGELGVSSMAVNPAAPGEMFVSTGQELRILNWHTGRTEAVPVDGLEDVHELTVVGNSLWIANTGKDEVVALDCTTYREVRRVRLAVFRGGVALESSLEDQAGALQVVDRFHSNQIFEGYDGKLYVLVHHVGGRQILRQVATRALKVQGDGGVVCIDSGESIPLRLSGPHSVTLVRGEYWVCDSLRGTVRCFDDRWRTVGEIRVNGWGRGTDLSSDGRYCVVGISAPRRRYLDVMGTSAGQNALSVIELERRECIGQIVVPGVEQINNVYAMSPIIVAALHDLSLRAP